MQEDLRKLETDGYYTISKRVTMNDGKPIGIQVSAMTLEQMPEILIMFETLVLCKHKTRLATGLMRFPLNPKNWVS